MASYFIDYDQTKTTNVDNLIDMTLVIKLNLSDEQKQTLISIDRNDFAKNLIKKSNITEDMYTFYGWHSLTDLNILFNNKEK